MDLPQLIDKASFQQRCAISIYKRRKEIRHEPRAVLAKRQDNEYRVFSAGSVRKWSKFGLECSVKDGKILLTTLDQLATTYDAAIRRRSLGPVDPSAFEGQLFCLN
jgi:hypothetical protein